MHCLSNNLCTTHSSLYVCVQYKDKKQMIELTYRFMEQGGLVVTAKCFSSLHPWSGSGAGHLSFHKYNHLYKRKSFLDNQAHLWGEIKTSPRIADASSRINSMIISVNFCGHYYSNWNSWCDICRWREGERGRDEINSFRIK